jgi:hypothetical protein
LPQASHNQNSEAVLFADDEEDGKEPEPEENDKIEV